MGKRHHKDDKQQAQGLNAGGGWRRQHGNNGARKSKMEVVAETVGLVARVHSFVWGSRGCLCCGVAVYTHDAQPEGRGGGHAEESDGGVDKI